MAAGTKQGSLSGFPELEGLTDGSSMLLICLSATHLLFQGLQQLMGSGRLCSIPACLLTFLDSSVVGCRHRDRLCRGTLQDVRGQLWAPREASLPLGISGQQHCLSLGAMVTLRDGLCILLPRSPAKVEDLPVTPRLPFRAFLGDGHSSADCITLLSRSGLTGKCGPSPQMSLGDRLLPGILLRTQSSLCWTVGGRQ